MAKYCYDYPRPAVTSDCAIFGFDGKELNVLLIKRKNEPYKDKWAFPGGFLNMNETVEECAQRELKEEAGIERMYLEQLHVFSSPGRDPRGRTVTVAFLAMVRMSDFKPVAGDDASIASWFTVSKVPALAFDHDAMLMMARKRIRSIMNKFDKGLGMLNEQFTMHELHAMFEAVLDRKIDRRNFTRKMLKSGLLSKLDAKKDEVPYRSPALFRVKNIVNDF